MCSPRESKFKFVHGRKHSAVDKTLRHMIQGERASCIGSGDVRDIHGHQAVLP
jgi:hypothetical protein